MSLLDEARKVATEFKRNTAEASEEMVDLAVAYAKHEVTAKQASRAMGCSVASASNKLKHALISAVRTGKLK